MRAAPLERVSAGSDNVVLRCHIVCIRQDDDLAGQDCVRSCHGLVACTHVGERCAIRAGDKQWIVHHRGGPRVSGGLTTLVLHHQSQPHGLPDREFVGHGSENVAYPLTRFPPPARAVVIDHLALDEFLLNEVCQRHKLKVYQPGCPCSDQFPLPSHRPSGLWSVDAYLPGYGDNLAVTAAIAARPVLRQSSQLRHRHPALEEGRGRVEFPRFGLDRFGAERQGSIPVRFSQCIQEAARHAARIAVKLGEPVIWSGGPDPFRSLLHAKQDAYRPFVVVE